MGSVSADTVDPKTQKLTDIMEGGQNFVARLTAINNAEAALAAERKRYDATLDKKTTLEAAKESRDKAAKELNEAQAQVQEMLKSARAEADRIIVDARNTSQQAQAYAKQLKEQAEDQYRKHIAEAEGKKSEAEAMRAEAATLHASAASRQRDVHKRQTDLAEEKREVEELRQQLQAKVKTLSNALAQVAK